MSGNKDITRYCFNVLLRRDKVNYLTMGYKILFIRPGEGWVWSGIVEEGVGGREGAASEGGGWVGVGGEGVNRDGSMSEGWRRDGSRSAEGGGFSP